MKLPRFVLVCVCSLCLASEASAVPIDVRFLGGITSVADDPVDLSQFLAVGAPVVIDLSWDTNAPNSCAGSSNPNASRSGVYSMTSVSMAVGGWMFTAGGVIEADAPVGNCGFDPFPTGVDFRLLNWQTSSQVCFPGDIDCIGVPVAVLGALNSLGPAPGASMFGYHDAPGAIPGPLPFEGWPTRFFSRAFDADGQLTTVPEPGSWVLVGTGLAWWRVRARRRGTR